MSRKGHAYTYTQNTCVWHAYIHTQMHRYMHTHVIELHTYIHTYILTYLLCKLNSGITGGEEDGVSHEDVDNASLYSQPDEVWKVEYICMCTHI